MLFPSMLPFVTLLCHFRRHRFPYSERTIALMPSSATSTQAFIAGDSRNAGPVSMSCDCPPLMNASRPRKKAYGLSHIIQYLTEVEVILQSSTSSSPAIRYQHCYQNNNQTFFKSIGSTLAKPMLRTLIYGDVHDKASGNENGKNKKNHFDQRIREARVLLDGQNMYSFVLGPLRQAAETLDADVRYEMIPGLLDQIKWIATNHLSTRSTGTNAFFNRLASGRRYQGNLESLIIDLFPDLLGKYHEASRNVGEREVLEYVIKNDLISREKAQHKRASSAISRCLDKFYPIGAHSPSRVEEKEYSRNGLKSGKRCEESCSSFLHNEYTAFRRHSGERYLNTERRSILQNIYINVRQNGDQPGRKYVPPKTFRKGAGPKQKLDGSGIIWTDRWDKARHRMCSEFDAIVLSRGTHDVNMAVPNGQYNNTSIEAIVEAKKTISPSTLYDILKKKLGAVEALLDDQSAELMYKDGETTEAIPFLTEGVRLSFVVYGSELQKPENAADSIRAIAASTVVTSDVDEVIRALERDDVMVEVKSSSALHIVQRLKSVVEGIQARNQIDVTMFIEDSVDFL